MYIKFYNITLHYGNVYPTTGFMPFPTPPTTGELHPVWGNPTRNN